MSDIDSNVPELRLGPVVRQESDEIANCLIRQRDFEELSLIFNDGMCLKPTATICIFRDDHPSADCFWAWNISDEVINIRVTPVSLRNPVPD